MVRIRRTKAMLAIPARTFPGVALQFLLLGSLSIGAAAQRNGPIDQIPDEHHPPSLSDIERMERNNPHKPVSAPDHSLEGESCLLPPLDLISSPVISTTQLQATFKAKWAYHKACASVRKKNDADAAKHLRDAVSQAPKYAMAWVTLAQVLDREQRNDEARRACLQASTVDATYIPAYLCLADMAARDHAWNEVLKLSSRGVDLIPSKNALAYKFRPPAFLNLKK